jgi:hypothetical protein
MMGSHLVHGVAWFSTRILPLRAAMDVTRHLGRLLPPLEVQEAPIVASRLRGGTCLTRSIAIAARVPGTSVTIGGAKNAGSFAAHAWVELEGKPLSGQTASKVVLVRLS